MHINDVTVLNTLVIFSKLTVLCIHHLLQNLKTLSSAHNKFHTPEVVTPHSPYPTPDLCPKFTMRCLDVVFFEFIRRGLGFALGGLGRYVAPNQNCSYFFPFWD